MVSSCFLMIITFVFLLFFTELKSSSSIYLFDSQLPPRLQWLANEGYCGEVSTIAAGLKYGQYFSQFDVRDIATGTQQRYYLIGFNDVNTTERIKLNYDAFDSKNNIGAEKYLAWIKGMTRRGYAVTIGVYMNYYLFYGIVAPSAGEFDYDHIVSVSSIISQYDDDEYHPDDIITISDHGLWAPRITGPTYLFNYTFRDFIGTREEANAKLGNLYTLPYSSKLTTWNFGIAHSGVMDEDKDTLRSILETSLNYESPEIDNKSNLRPVPMALLLTLRVHDMEDGVKYNIYRYNDEKSVPTSQFNSHSIDAFNVTQVVCCQASEVGYFVDNNTFVMNIAILSNEKVIFRTVRADAK